MPSTNEVLNLPNGANWLKADLHVHTPASPDVSEEYKSATPDDIVAAALQKGLDAIAITDHNTAEWCDAMVQAAEGTPLTVFPGVEISTPQGHLLALFDNQVPSSDIEDLLISVGIDRSDFGSTEAATSKGIAGVSDAIAQHEGIAVAAHVNGDKGFLRVIAVNVERQRAFNSRNLRALEIKDQSEREVYQYGKGSNFERRLPCIQSSDSWADDADNHTIDGIGNRFTFLKMGERSLSGLKLALIDPDIRVRLDGDQSRSPENVIVGMWTSGGFFDGQTIRFNDNVSCLIGDTGSGKSAAIELLRFALDQQPRVEKIRSEVESLLQHQLRELNSVHVLVRKGGTHYLVERAWARSPGKPLVRRVSNDMLYPIDGVDLQRFFPFKCFSQSEIIEFARESEVRLSLTDDLIDSLGEHEEIRQAKTALRENSAAILAEEQNEKAALDQLTELPALVDEVGEIDKLFEDPRIPAHEHWYEEKRVIDAVDSKVDIISKSITTSFGKLKPDISWPEDFKSLPNADLLCEIKTLYKTWVESVTAAEDEVFNSLKQLKQKLKSVRGEWSGKFDVADAEYRALLDSLDPDVEGVATLSERRKELRERVTDLENIRHNLRTVIRPRLRELIQKREQLLDVLQLNRNAINCKRTEKAAELTEKLDHEIRLKVRSQANSGPLRDALEVIAEGSYLYSDDLDALADETHPVPLVKSLLGEDFDTLASITGLDRSKLTKLMDTIRDRNRLSKLYELQLTDVDDVIEVQLKINNGEYRNIEDLSHGQKCMVVLMVALAEGDFPLLVDQPEDALHAPSIERGIVSTLRTGRGDRQCIFGTRNANILVSADSEQIIALEADANNGRVVATGSLDSFDQRRLVIHHVEAGEEAFQRRQTKYTLQPSSQ